MSPWQCVRPPLPPCHAAAHWKRSKGVGMSITRVLAGVLGAVALITPAAAAQAAVPDKLAERYTREYRQAKQAGGDPGRHIVRDDVKTKRGVRDARPGELRRSIAVLERMQGPAV